MATYAASLSRGLSLRARLIEDDHDVDRWSRQTQMKPQLQFLRIRWDVDTPEHGAVTLEAMLCLPHRGRIALAYPSAQGTGELGETCDFCAGLDPRTLGSEPSHPPHSQLGSPDGKPRTARPLSAPAER